MNIKQISVFLENKKGRLAELTALLARQGVNIRALSLADTADFGVLRFIVSDSVKCFDVLKENNFVVQMTDVIAVEIDDQPGGLNRVLVVFDKSDINVEYMYAFVEKKAEKAIVIFRIDKIQLAIKTLEQNNISMLSADILAEL